MKLPSLPLGAFLRGAVVFLSLVCLVAAEDKAVVGSPPPAPAPAAPTVPDASGTPAVVVTKLRLGVVPGTMQFSPRILTVKAGAKVKLLFENPKDAQPHNFILVKPGKLQEVGELSERMIQSDPALAVKRNYVPSSPEIVVNGTKLVGIGQMDLIDFTAPAVPGDYPFLCSFPGHWRLMNGILKVEP